MQSRIRIVLAILILAVSLPLFAAGAPALTGTVTDSLGAVISNASVELLNAASQTVRSTTTGADGGYSFALSAPGSFRVRAQAPTFQPAVSDLQFTAADHPARIDLVLSPSVVAQEIVVTATGVPTPELRTAASIDVIGAPELTTHRDVEQELRLLPGTQISRTGQAGAVASLNVRGAPSDTNKTLIDGVPINDIGGTMNFGNLPTAGFERAELYRGPNSALYGTDALGGVLVLTTRHGATPLPELNYSADGGTFGTLHQEGSLGGAWRRFDYFAGLARFDTQNSTPNSQFHNASALANFGWQLLPATTLRVTGRRSVSAFNSANATDLYGIPDDGVSREEDTSFGATLESRLNPRWHNLLRYGGLRLRSQFASGEPTGICYDSSNFPTFACTPSSAFPVYLGKPVTIRGANGYQVTGQGILQFSAFPFQSSVLSDRDSVYAQSDYRFNEHLTALGAFRYEAEGGFQNFGFAPPVRDRGNYSYTMELNGGFWNRLYYTAAAGLDNNSVFGFAASPRASLVYHLVRPGNQRILSGTRLFFNFGKGVKEPSIFYETNSLFELLQSIPPQAGSPTGAQLIAQYHVHPFRAELARSYEGGVQQFFFHARARLSVTYFHNEFGDQAEFVSAFGLHQLGISQPLLDSLSAQTPGGFFGAAVNSLAYRAQGAEVEAEYRILPSLSVRGGWTYTSAVVQHSFNSDNLSPSLNPAFPTIPIGAFSPLVGARPFHIAPHTGFVAVDWNRGRYLLRATGTLVSRRDDSDFLSDPNFGPTLLLPNRNLDPAYQRIDVYGAFRLHSHVSLYTSMENLLNQRYYETFGYPALPFTIRSGVQVTLGGESWKF